MVTEMGPKAHATAPSPPSCDARAVQCAEGRAVGDVYMQTDGVV